jgi:hypothetical protein
MGSRPTNPKGAMAKPEIRNPKSETNPKSEFANVQNRGGCFRPLNLFREPIAKHGVTV